MQFKNMGLIHFNLKFFLMQTQSKKQIEQDYIALYKTTDPNFGYNLSSGGDGLIANEATREKMRKSHIGKKHTEETKQKISTALKQYERSEEHQKHLTAALQIPHLGFNNHKHTERAKELMAAAHSKKVQCVETGEIFDSAEQAVKKLNMKSNHINDCINNPKRYKTSGGYH